MLNQLEEKVYVYKNPYTEFFCPLCRSKRAISINPRLTKRNYLQLIVASIFCAILFYPLMKIMSLIFIFPIWIGFEMAKRAKYRRELNCPYCGFDASWYKTDVKVAKKLVEEFWIDKRSFDLPSQPLEQPLSSDELRG